MGWQAEIEDLVEIGKSGAEVFPVLRPSLDEGGKFPELLAPDGSLGIKGLQVIAKVAVGVFVVISRREFAEIPSEAFAAGIVLARRTPTVTSPVTETLRISFQWRTGNNIHGSSLSHGQVVRRIERLGGDISESPCIGGQDAIFNEWDLG